MNLPDDPLLPFSDLPPAVPRSPGRSGSIPKVGHLAPPPERVPPGNLGGGAGVAAGARPATEPSHAAPTDTTDLSSPAEAAALSDREAETLSRAADLLEWKNELRRDIESWLATIDEIPEGKEAEVEEADDAPDLYAFYEQFAAANTESRKANRRTAEAMSQWGETLSRFESGLQPLRETTAQLLAAHPRSGELSRAHCLVWVELLDRMYRLARAFASPPVTKRTWWGAGADAAWRTAWESQRQALDILVGHFEGLLRKEGVVRIETIGQSFDPSVMMAVAMDSDATHPPQTVLEEVAAGYRRHDELLRPAQVKVSR